MDEEVEMTLEAFDMAFSKKKIYERKKWLEVYDENDVLDYSQPRFSYVEAINKELEALQNRYDAETRHSQDIEKQQEWQTKIIEALNKLSRYSS